MRLCLVPIIGTGATHDDARRPKYFSSVDVPEGWGGTDYGFEPWMLVVSDLSASSITFLNAQADAFLVPENLDANLTAGQVLAVEAQLEVMNVPAEWVSTAFTWRQVIRIVLGVFTFMALFARIYHEATGTTTRVFTGGVDLSRTYGSLGANVRTALTATADNLGLDRSWVVGSTTLRALLRSIGEQMAVVPLGIGSTTV